MFVQFQVQQSVTCDTHPHPRVNQPIGDLLCLCDEDREFLVTELVRAKESSNVTDGGLEETTAQCHGKRMESNRYTSTYSTESLVWDLLKSIVAVKLRASLKNSVKFMMYC